MKIFRFDPDVGKEIEQFGSVKAIISRILHLEDEAVISSVHIQPGGKIGHHQAASPQLFLLVKGEGWIRGENDEKIAVQEGQAIFWEQGEWHESGSESGMIAVIIEGVRFDPAKLMPLLKRDEP
jgi:quercetin dioxygenase-like cupin family protein